LERMTAMKHIKPLNRSKIAGPAQATTCKVDCEKIAVVTLFLALGNFAGILPGGPEKAISLLTRKL